VSTARVAEVKVLADPDLIRDLAEEWSGVEGLQTSEVRNETDVSELAFDIGTVASIVALIQFAAIDGPFLPKLWNVFRRHQPNELVIQTPFKSVHLQWTGDVTEAQLTAALHELLRDDAT
jgi:hypothetical protein